MQKQSFGSYLRMLRLSRSPGITQEALAKAVGRSKMTISQFEQEKNAPPQGALLDSFVSALSLSDEEEGMFRFLAAESRCAMPEDVQDYFFENPSIYDAIRAAKKSNVNDTVWHDIAQKFKDSAR
mgnify:CR=1 FL=1